MTHIRTGRNYSDDGISQTFRVTKRMPSPASLSPNAERIEYVEDRTGYRGHLLLDNGILYAPELHGGQYYPTEYQIVELKN